MQIIVAGRLGTRFHSSQVINRPHTATDCLILGPARIYGAKKTGPTGQTGDYFAKIAPSSQKAAPLICLRSRGTGGLPIITCDPLSRRQRFYTTTKAERKGMHARVCVCEREREGTLRDEKKGTRSLESAASVALRQGRRFFCSFLRLVLDPPHRCFPSSLRSRRSVTPNNYAATLSSSSRLHTLCSSVFTCDLSL